MAITRASGQAAGTTADNTTAVTLAYPNNVVAGNLLVILVTAFKESSDPFVLADISKSAGTATLGAFQLDSSVNYNPSPAWVNSAVYSAPVTGSGSCTITVGGAPAGSYFVLALQELEGADVTSGRLEGQNTGTGATGAPTTGDVTSAGGAAFMGIVGTNTSGATTHTPDGAFTEIAESEDGSTHMTGSAEDRIVTTGTTDAASWTAPTTVDWAAALAVYKEAAAGAAHWVPESDVSAGSWTPSAGGDLFAMIDEQPTPSDADHIRSAASPSNDTCEVRLALHLTPDAGTCTIGVRARSL